ncbi:MAG: cyclase [Acidobacteriaceae bacterium]|nr:cyclase [Acidobacteriaceae bacterium]
MNCIARNSSILTSLKARQLCRTLTVLMLLPILWISAVRVGAQTAPPRKIAPGVWFLLGDASKGYCNNIVIEMHDYLIVVDANYPGRAKELLSQVKELSPKPVRYVFDTHAHRDHAYGNIIWTNAGATTLAYKGVLDEMNRYEPTRWITTASAREDVRDLNLTDAPRPRKTFHKSPFILKDSTREVRFYFLGWAHTRGDGFVWLPKERILCTGDAAVNGPRNKLLDADLANWPRAIAKAEDFQPVSVLPGHGLAGGPEILVGQRQFLLDLYAEVKRQAAAGKTPSTMDVHLPVRDDNWIPKSLTQDIEVAYSEIKEHQPAGALLHDWK